jgi:uncharacterized damage-inducible protein DinB
MSTERELLVQTLGAQRRHVLGAIDGLTDEQLRRPVLPSGWHCIGMVKHLALADEHYWFRSIVGGEPLDYFPEGPNAEWQLTPGETTADVLALYRDEIDRADTVIGRTALDDAPRRRDPMWEEWGIDFPDLRTILLHMITETACHAGHLDAAREIIDGKQWIVV